MSFVGQEPPEKGWSVGHTLEGHTRQGAWLGEDIFATCLPSADHSPLEASAPVRTLQASGPGTKMAPHPTPPVGDAQESAVGCLLPSLLGSQIPSLKRQGQVQGWPGQLVGQWVAVGGSDLIP